ncbi:hypothetical protein M3G00_17065 [Brevibacterium casei]|uniref:hypothetical protein n=2 Tax=Bacteria TaxID=2 RepID=UPI000E650456|nr:hypothetical protein [Brevibacterium casei]MCT2184639.1 hypothetical protein [Brevibacterium casei]
MAVTYLGSRPHIADILSDLNSSTSLVVVDAVTLNREELSAELNTTASAEVRLMIRPEVVTEVISDGAAEYLSWLDSIESQLRGFGAVKVLRLPRAAEDWEEDVQQALEFNAFCLVEPAQGMSLITRDRRCALVRGAVETASSDCDVQVGGKPSTVSAKSVAQALSVEVGQTILAEKGKPADLLDAMVTAGMDPGLSGRIVAAQQLVVTESSGDETDGGDALQDFQKYVGALKKRGRNG